jgi:hypothetical protein
MPISRTTPVICFASERSKCQSDRAQVNEKSNSWTLYHPLGYGSTQIGERNRDDSRCRDNVNDAPFR